MRGIANTGKIPMFCPSQSCQEVISFPPQWSRYLPGRRWIKGMNIEYWTWVLKIFKNFQWGHTKKILYGVMGYCRNSGRISYRYNRWNKEKGARQQPWKKIDDWTDLFENLIWGLLMVGKLLMRIEKQISSTITWWRTI